MDATNGGRPLPWHDTARCEGSDIQFAGVSAQRGVCGGPMVPVEEMCNGFEGNEDCRIACIACGLGRVGTAADVAKTKRANAAWLAYERGEVHPDRGCQRCNCALPLDRVRLCAACVEKDNTERQGSLFPEADR